MSTDEFIEGYKKGIRDFSNQQLQSVNLAGVTIENAFFGKANLLWANFEGAKLVNCDFSDAILRGVNFNKAQLDFACFKGANVIEASFDYASAANTNFDNASINSSFVGANLQNAHFLCANIDFTDFSGANLTNADFTGSVAKNIVLEGAITKNTKALPVAFVPPPPAPAPSPAYLLGYEKGYSYAIGKTSFDENAWKIPFLAENIAQNAENEREYQLGFMQTYGESMADGGNQTT